MLKYYPDGNRIWKDSSETGKRKYIVDITCELPVILMELNNSGGIVKTYIYANSEIIAQHDGGVKNHYTYNPFGELFAAETTENVSNPFKFTGQWFDDEIEEYYLRARQYNPHIARFTSRDPVRGEFTYPLTLHKYLYCANDPINMIDPTGEFLSGALLVEPIMAGYEVHYGALGFAAYGVATGSESFLTLGLEMQKMIVPVMAIAMVARWNPIEKMGYDLDQQHGNNWFGHFNIDPGKMPKYLAIGITLSYVAYKVGGCSLDPTERLPSREEWRELWGDDMQRFERPPDDPPRR